MFVNNTGSFYFGDMAAGDREATTQEIAAWEAARTRAAIDSIKLTPRQIRQALTALGLRATVDSAIGSSSQDMKDWWEFSLTIERNHPLVIGMGQALDKTPAELDAVFLLGATL